ncbi:MAG TPA: ElyC/SanA/YdcF family protein, partial [Cyclobacteriaceae bacterium]|nr:ElyC/SanA/YdcF family protein [Cyclobacteriaceae bacterium]
MKRWRRLRTMLIALPLMVMLSIFCANWWVIKSTEDKVLSNSDQLTGKSVALVLGTSNKLRDGSANPYFENRIKSAAQLYHEGKVIHFILSGDNRSKYYNEPLRMKKALVLLGVPE